MKAFVSSEKELWCMDLAYVDKLAKDNNGVKYFSLRRDLFDRILDANGIKRKNSNETVGAFLTMITKKTGSKKIGLAREQNLLESLKSYAKLAEYNFKLVECKFTLQWARPRLHLLNVQYDPWKYYSPLHGRQWIQVHLRNDTICYNTKF